MTNTDFIVLVLEGAYPSSVAITLDMLKAASTLAPRLGLPVPKWTMASARGGQVSLGHGLCIGTQPIPNPRASVKSTIVLPGLGVDTPQSLQQRMAQADVRWAAQWLQRHVHQGGVVAASCSAVFVLQGAGLLERRTATTSWWLAHVLQQLEPTCHVDVNRMVCTDGPITTAGAALAQTDLMLHLLRTQYGSLLSDQVARALLIDQRQAQAPFIAPEVLANGDALVSRLTTMVQDNFPHPPSIKRWAEAMHLTERTLSRHVRRATGNSPSALLQSIRLQHARALLASSRMSVEQVAAAVGYQDATALRRLMRKTAGANPSQFRPNHFV